ncbi:ribose-phosphate pyrophosphokinase [Candidatus Nomurabacteria bacterium]|nr:MAG: ribose-phosphate pyrophosphokinase [Candidatus Nomurabacteria bacterium]
MKNGKLKIFAGSTSHDLTTEIIAEIIKNNNDLGLKITDKEFFKFKCGEIMTRPLESVRGCDTFIIQSAFGDDVHSHIWESLILVDALKLASAGSICLVMPHMPYTRQDRKDKPRHPISARLLANQLERAGVNQFVTVKLHNPTIQGFFDIPCDNISTNSLIMDYIVEKYVRHNPDGYRLCGPDLGSTKPTRKIADRYHLSRVIYDKDRPGTNIVGEMTLIGDVEGCDVILIDDIFDTGNTIFTAKKSLMEKGAKSVILAITHMIGSDGGLDKLADQDFKEVIITDTIPIPKEKMFPGLKILSVAPRLADIIYRIHTGESVNGLVEDF